MAQQIDPRRLEALGPAERILQTLLTYADHMVHNRPGVVVTDASTPMGVKWHPVTWRDEPEGKVVYRLDKRGKGTVRTRIGLLDGATVRDGDQQVGRYSASGLFPEVVAWLYRQVAEVWRMDNEFAARWGSYAFAQDHRDLKVVLAAFLLVQARAGEPVREGDEVLFHDDDLRAVGEAMCLIRRKDGRDLNPKLLLRVGEVLALPQVAAINRELGFGRSARNPALGRWPKAVEKWLRHREHNPRMLEGLVKAGFRTTVMALARKVGYQPESPRFFEILRWKQKQADDGRRTIAIGADVSAATTWDALSEAEICERIVTERPNWKVIVGRVPTAIGLTRAIVAAAVQTGCLSDTDLIILTPTLEDLDLLRVPAVGERWLAAAQAAESQRAAHIAQRVQRKETAEVLEQAADQAVRKALEEVTRDLRVYVIVDKSGSMEGALQRAVAYLTVFLQGFPLDRTHVAVFNTSATEVVVKHPSKKGVEHAFSAHKAGGGTSYGAGVKALARHAPNDDEDTILLFVGDQADSKPAFDDDVRESGLRPVAFGLLEVVGSMNTRGRAVEETATRLGIPCFRIDEDMFGDAYAVPRTLRNLIASTPVVRAAAPKVSLVEAILRTPLLDRPVWA